jgi:hypothetical protein
MNRKSGYSVLETLFCVGVVSSLVAGSYFAVNCTLTATAGMKLEQDVKVVNRAIQVYLTHGGRIPGGVSGDDVLARLRRQAANPHVAGLKGSLLDSRMTIRWQNPSEASSPALRAYWNDEKKRFDLAHDGNAPGIKEFYSSDVPLVMSR